MGPEITRGSRPLLPRLAIAVAIVALVVAGFLLGRSLLSAPTQQLIEPGAIVEVHLQTGLLLLGTYEGSRDGYLILSRPVTATGAANGSSLQLQTLGSEPFSIDGNILVESRQISLLGALSAGSSLHTRYLEAIGAGGPAQTPSPSP